MGFSFRDRINPYPQTQIDRYLEGLIQRWGQPTWQKVVPFAKKDSTGARVHKEALVIYRFD
jgi:hypothetical protein